MGACRSCNAEVKPYQIYCPNCGIKHPLLNKEELKYFKTFQKKYKPVFIIIIITLLVFSALFIIKVPVPRTVSYNIKESPQEIRIEEEPLECTEEYFRYSMSYAKPQVFAGTLKVTCNIENLENERGVFEYTVKIVYKLSMEEKQKTSELSLGPYENETVSEYFESVTAPGEVDYKCKINPPVRTICRTKTERTVVEKEKETVELKQEKSYKTLFEFLVEKLD